jgi:hypothetical protein
LLNFHTTPSGGSSFGGWSGCDSINASGDCLLILAAAYAAANQTGITLIEAQALTFDGDLLLNKALLLRGGFGAAFSAATTGVTTVRGKITIGAGSLAADRLTIR